jgi:putative two-component system response regulator
MPASASPLLIVDDNPENLTVLGEILQAEFRVRAATNGRRALELAALQPRPALALVDVMMPDMDGYQLLAQLRADPATRDIPVVFVTAMDAAADEARGLAMGAADYITKPLRPPIVLARVRTQLQLRDAREALRERNVELEAEVARRTAENQRVQDVSIRALARLAETRDPETGNHLRRTQEYVRLLARRLQAHARFAGHLDDRTIDLLAKSANLHDIGKVGIPDHVLLKPGKLDRGEWDIMKTHAALGAEAIEQAERDDTLDGEGNAAHPVEFLRLAKEIAHWHHEMWDGHGYPDGLAGEAIPVSARLMALADVFDALISRRVYKEPMSFERARAIIENGRGRHFDPDMVDAFLASYDDFVAIAERYSDSEAAVQAKLAAVNRRC